MSDDRPQTEARFTRIALRSGAALRAALALLAALALPACESTLGESGMGQAEVVGQITDGDTGFWVVGAEVSVRANRFVSGNCDEENQIAGRTVTSGQQGLYLASLSMSGDLLRACVIVTATPPDGVDLLPATAEGFVDFRLDEPGIVRIDVALPLDLGS